MGAFARPGNKLIHIWGVGGSDFDAEAVLLLPGIVVGLAGSARFLSSKKVLQEAEEGVHGCPM